MKMIHLDTARNQDRGRGRERERVMCGELSKSLNDSDCW